VLNTINQGIWPPRSTDILKFRQNQILTMRKNPVLWEGAKAYYKNRRAEFISHWCDTWDPRNVSKGRAVRIPFVLFQRQIELIDFLTLCLDQEQNGLIEKSRDMGATWGCVGFSVHTWLYRDGASVGWGSRKAQLVDRLGDMDSIFEKCRAMIMGLPREFWPKGFKPSVHLNYMRIINPENGATITGESGDDIGRGGRKLVYFKDESAHYEHPESIEAALADNTNVQIDISSVNGLGNVFHRRREAGVDWAPGQPLVRGRTQVFVMDWRDHPAKTDAWYKEREAKAREEGLLHLFRQEVDRNYSAAIEGTIIPAIWVESAIDAHIKLGWPEDGGWMGALDVADGGGDKNAQVKRQGVILRFAQEWGERDTGATARRAISNCEGSTPIDHMYDSIGVGSGVKAEINRLNDEGLMPGGIRFVSWEAGAPPLWPDKRVIEDDPESPLNKDFYKNLKAQGWWELRRRFERVHRAITEGTRYPIEQMISIDSRIPILRQIQKELSQPTVSKAAGRLKLVVDKAPEGTRSPNVGDGIMMCYHPVDQMAYDSTLSWV
jgi:phage terminase large subunit